LSSVLIRKHFFEIKQLSFLCLSSFKWVFDSYMTRSTCAFFSLIYINVILNFVINQHVEYCHLNAVKG
jgi:hypothetical protein